MTITPLQQLDRVAATLSDEDRQTLRNAATVLGKLDDASDSATTRALDSFRALLDLYGNAQPQPEPNPYIVTTHGQDGHQHTFRVRTDGLRNHLIDHGISYSEVWDHIADVDAGHILTADDGTEFRLARNDDAD